MKKKPKIIVICITSFLFLLVLALVIPFSIMGIKTSKMNKDYTYLKSDTTYAQKVEVAGLNLVTQHISCGYATIEMLSEYYGNKVSEDDLDAKNKGAVSTSSTDGFLKEINASITNKEFVKKTYLTNDNYFMLPIFAQKPPEHLAFTQGPLQASAPAGLTFHAS